MDLKIVDISAKNVMLEIDDADFLDCVFVFVFVFVFVIITLPLGLSVFEQRGCESSHSKYSSVLNPLKTTMTFRPKCHGFHKSAFVMVIKGYDSITPLVLRFDAAGGFRMKFQATTYHPPPSPLISFSSSCSLISSHSKKSNILHFQS